MSGVTSVSTVGWSTPSAVSSPPVATLAPAASASSTHEATRRARAGEISADTSVASSSGSPTTRLRTPSTSSAVKSSAIERCT